MRVHCIYRLYTHIPLISQVVMQPFGASEKEQPVSFVSTMSSGAVVIAAVIARDIRPRPGFAVTRRKDCIFSWKPDESCHESESARTSTQLLSFSLLFSLFSPPLFLFFHLDLSFPPSIGGPATVTSNSPLPPRAGSCCDLCLALESHA